MRKYIIFLCSLFLLTGCAGQSFERRHSLTYDFERISTFAFESRYCGIVGISAAEKDGLIVFIQNNIEKELMAQGFIPVRTHPEMRIRFGLILKGNGKSLDPKKIKQMKEEDSPEYSTTFDYKVGTLVIDVVDPFYHRILWRAAIDTKIQAATSQEKKKVILSRDIKKLLKDFLQVTSTVDKNK